MKAVFIDHMGTLVEENSKYAYALIKECFENSDAKSMEETSGFWMSMFEGQLDRCNGELYKEEYEIALEVFDRAREAIGLRGDSSYYCNLLTQHWIYAPAYPDVAGFFEECPLPIYIVTNNDTKYIEESMRQLGLKPAGIISSQTAGYHKPRKEIFEKALAVSGCSADEVIHIGDSMVSDINGAAAAGIRALLLDRTGNTECGQAERIRSLTEALEYIIE